ncbi:MAG: hypothetical protein V3T78_09945 [Dehalococcoidia bacterium]
MFPDPAPIGSFEWSEIGKLLHNLWFLLALASAFAMIMLTAHAIIPSLVSTRHLPPSANMLRFSLTLTGLGILGLALTLLAYTVGVARVIEIFYDRYWI